ncbi:MAG: hypothetical protein EBU84_17055 [Actinobacteria bacterium]|nr:hypothetical protein [Actinomycetota bacterium]
MAIADDDLERVRAASSIVEVVQQHVALRRVGRNWVGLCPFHAEKSGSFNVREETGRYKCFGCSASGDVFKFVQEIEHLDFMGAVERLATRSRGAQADDRSHGASSFLVPRSFAFGIGCARREGLFAWAWSCW